MLCYLGRYKPLVLEDSEMTRIVTFAGAVTVFAMALLVLGGPAGRADKPVEGQNSGAKLDGAWRLVGIRDGDEYRKPEGWEQHKLVVGGRFNWTTSKDGKILYSAGGKCAFDGDVYTESVEFAHERDFLVGKEVKCTWKLDGDKWYHKGTIKTDQGDLTIDELWERVKK
jgi:hypothetical protein